MLKCMNPSHPCNELRKKGYKGVAVIPFNYNTNDFLLGHERFGTYKDTYNFFAGGEDKKDNGCLIRTAYREFTEESGWEISFNNFLKIITCPKSNKFLILPTNRGAAMFVALVPNIDINVLNNKIISRNSNPKLSINLQEMDDVTLFPLYSIPPTLNILSSWVQASLPIIKTFIDNINEYCNDATVNPPQPSVNPSQPIVNPSQPSVNPSQPSVNPSTIVNPSTSKVFPSQPSVNPQQKVNSNTIPIPITIPNALTIIINTSVPGYQTIKYNPNMTLQNIDKDERTIWFDPLVPLEQSIIDKVPENIRVLEFFNKGLYESLINAHGNKKQITLEQAKKNKIIDNNIQVTLNALFPTNGILYIKGEPYAIADVQWTKGDWKIDRKIKDIPEIDVTKISDPIAYRNIIKSEVLEGNKQLEQLPKDLIYGANFNKSIEDIALIDKEKELNAKKVAEEARLRAVEEARLRAEKIRKPTILTIEDADKPLLTDANPIAKPLLTDANPIDKPLLALEAKPSIVVEDIKNIQMSEENKPLLKISLNSTKAVRSYFGSDFFYSMISMIFKYMSDDQKLFIQNIFKNTTNIDVKGLSTNISKAAYIFTITGTKNISSSGVSIKKSFTDGLRVISNFGGGDCLFLAVADAINYYNYYNDIDKKIIYNRWGNGNNMFTTKILRNIVSTEIIKLFNSDEDLNHTFLELAQVNLEVLNDAFERIMLTEESVLQQGNEEYYTDTIMDTYKSYDNFFVIIPDIITNRNRPFELVSNNDEIKKYIESEYYWADQKTIDIFNKILKLNIITINNTDGIYTIPFPTIKSDNNNTWNKYLFLYNAENHYELITFDYLLKVSSKMVRVKKVIFDRGSNILPPFYIVFLLFSSFYIKLLPADKEMVTLFINFFKAIQNSFNTIMDAPIGSDKNITNFITNFENYFGPIKREILGGATNNMERGASRFLKKADKQDSIQISFHITIDMELQKGKTLTKEQISDIKCIKGWNKVRKSFADFTGRKYVVPPIYDNLSDKYNKKENDKDKENDKEKNKNNITQKNINGGSRGKRRKTLKYLKYLK